jgi:hypothetical protein
MSHLKEHKGVTHVASRPRDDEGKPKAGVHYLKPQEVSPRFKKDTTARGNLPPVVEEPPVVDDPADADVE